MDDSAITLATRVLRPEVVAARYAFDEGAYWRVERLRDGRLREQRLSRPPVGKICYASNDNFITEYSFVVPASVGRSAASPAQVLCLIGAVLAIPVAMLVLSGSQPFVALAIGAAAAVLLGLQAYVEHIIVRDPAAARRLGAISAVYLVATHRRHSHRTRSSR